MNESVDVIARPNRLAKPVCAIQQCRHHLLQESNARERDRMAKLDARSAQARAYTAYLAGQRTLHLNAIERALGRGLSVTHRYAITMNGIAATLTVQEAARVAQVPGIASVRASRTVTLPDAPYIHLFVARGAVDLEGAGALVAGDAVRMTGVGGQQVTASEPAEVLVWEMHARVAS